MSYIVCRMSYIAYTLPAARYTLTWGVAADYQDRG